MKRMAMTLALALALAAFPSAWGSDAIAITRGEASSGEIVEGVRDVILINGPFAGHHYGGTNSIWIGSGPADDAALRRSLLGFDFAALPERLKGRKVRRAVLRLRYLQAKGEGVAWQLYTVKAVNGVWVEEEGSGRSVPNVCSWKYRLNFYQPWEGGEGLGQPGDGYEEAPLFTSEAEASAMRPGRALEVELALEVVNGWLEGGNGSLLLRLVEEGAAGETYVRFGSSEHPEPEYRPVLELEFES